MKVVIILFAFVIVSSQAASLSNSDDQTLGNILRAVQLLDEEVANYTVVCIFNIYINSFFYNFFLNLLLGISGGI